VINPLIAAAQGGGSIGPGVQRGTMTGQIPHPFDLLCGLNGGDHQPQIPRHRRLQRQQHKCVLLAPRLCRVQLFIVADHLFGQHEIAARHRASPSKAGPGPGRTPG
jgi:hypothetical protein